MRIRKKQHPLLHGAAFLLTGGMSGPASAAMMGGNALRNRKADEEAAALIAAAASQPAPARERASQRRPTVTERLTELRRLRDAGLITDEEHDTRRLQIIAGI